MQAMAKILYLLRMTVEYKITAVPTLQRLKELSETLPLSNMISVQTARTSNNVPWSYLSIRSQVTLLLHNVRTFKEMVFFPVTAGDTVHEGMQT